MGSTSKIDRIIFLTDELPYPPLGGGKIRDYYLLELLRDIAPVEILAFHESGSNASLPSGVTAEVIHRERPGFSRVFYPLRPYVVNGYSKKMEAALSARKGSSRILWASRLMMGKYLDFAHNLGFKTVLDEHNVESQLHRDSSKGLPWYYPQFHLLWQLKYYETLFCQKADQVVCVSSSDAQLLSHLAPKRPIDVLPNSIDTEYFTPSPTPVSQSGLLFTGTLNYQPNQEGLSWFVEKVLPILKRRLSPGLFPKIRVAGAKPSRAFADFLRQSGLEVIENPSSMLPYLHEAEIVIVPLLNGSGTRLKIMEAFAAGKCVVSTPIGAEGLALTHGEGIGLASSPEEFAEEIIRIQNNPALRVALGKQARKIATSRFDYRLQKLKLGEILNQVMLR